MRPIISVTAALAFCTCSSAAVAQPESAAATAASVPPVAAAPAATPKPAAIPAKVDLNGTSWTFDNDGMKVQESIDPKGNYIMQSADGMHLDHGVVVMKAGKACHTSAMNENGEDCWTLAPAAIGETVTAVNDQGRHLEVTRVAYVPLSMPH